MQNKRLLYVLLPAVLLIWGIILYQIADVLNEDDATIYTFTPAPLPAYITQNSATVDLLLNYADPFLEGYGRNVRVKTAGNALSVAAPQPAASLPSSQPAEPARPAWPDLIYSGTVSNPKVKKQLALLNVNSQSYILKEGDYVQSMHIKKVFPDSLQVRFDGELRWFIRASFQR